MKKIRLNKFITLLLLLVLSTSLLSACTLFGKGDINKFADELFPQLFANDALSANFFLENPSELGITPTASLPSPTGKKEYETSMRSMHTQAVLMASMFRYSDMTPVEKDLFAFLQNFFENSSKSADYYYLQGNYIGSYMGTQANIPIYLTEYKFRNKTDVDNYIALCLDSENAFESYVNFEKERINNGFGRATYVYIGAIKQCEAFTGADIINGTNPTPATTENFVLTNFKTKINAVDDKIITPAEKENYISKATSAINDTLLPAYVKLGSDILSLLVENNVNVDLFKGDYNSFNAEQIKTTPLNGKFNNRGLAVYDGGKEYYQLLFNDATGTNDSIPGALKKLEKAFIEANTAYWELNKEIQAELDKLNKTLPQDKQKTISGEIQRLYDEINWNDESELYGTLDELKSHITNDFPKMPETKGKTVIKQIDKSLAENYSPAAYFVSALDNPDSDEVIVVNSASGSTGYLLYDLFAHEGIPGHLYQYAYVKNSDLHNIIKVLSPTSYKESWAVYSQVYMSRFFRPGTLDNKLYRLNLYEYLYNGYLRAMVDIWINYENMDMQQVATKLAGFLSGEPADFMKYVENVYPLCVEVPTNAMTYFYGYLTFDEIKTQMFSKKICKTDLEFHKLILDNPYPFAMIKEKFGI